MSLVSGDTKPSVVHSWCWLKVTKIIPEEVVNHLDLSEIMPATLKNSSIPKYTHKTHLKYGGINSQEGTA